jgi:hypothetical protein
MKFKCFVVLACCAIAVAAVVAQSPMRAGLWEVTTEMQMPGMKMPEMKANQCVTPEQLKDPASALPKPSTDQAGKDACKTSDYKASGNTVTWKMACAAPQSMTGAGELTFSGDTYAGTMKMTMPQGDMTMRLGGKRVGDCKP